MQGRIACFDKVWRGCFAELDSGQSGVKKVDWSTDNVNHCVLVRLLIHSNEGHGDGNISSPGGRADVEDCPRRRWLSIRETHGRGVIHLPPNTVTSDKCKSLQRLQSVTIDLPLWLADWGFICVSNIDARNLGGRRGKFPRCFASSERPA